MLVSSSRTLEFRSLVSSFLVLMLQSCTCLVEYFVLFVTLNCLCNSLFYMYECFSHMYVCSLCTCVLGDIKSQRKIPSIWTHGKCELPYRFLETESFARTRGSSSLSYLFSPVIYVCSMSICMLLQS